MQIRSGGRRLGLGGSLPGIALIAMLAAASALAQQVRLGADSVVGQGSTFWFTLPLQVEKIRSQ